MWLIAAGTSSAGLPAGCCVDLLVHAVRYSDRRVALNMLRKRACFRAKRAKNIPQGLKPTLILLYFRHD